MPLPAFGAMQSVAAMPSTRRCRTTNRDRLFELRLTSTTREELRRIFDPANVEISRRGSVQLDAATFRTLLLMLYGAGLRFSEATGLTLADVDLAEGILTIRATKFYKSRLVPIGPQLATVLANYMALRRRGGLAQGETSFLLTNRDGTRLASSTVQAAFDALRRDRRSPRRGRRTSGSRACMISGTASRSIA